MVGATRQAPWAQATQVGVMTGSEPRTTLDSTLTGSSAEAELPRFIGPYRVEGLLGSGGMGDVFAVKDHRFDRVCALKRLQAGASSDFERELFLAEMRVTASLDHPHVVPVLDGGVDEDGLPWFVMPRLLGRSLSSLVQAEPLPMTDALGIFLKVASAVAHAHARGVLHLDIKPGNVWVGEHGLVYLLDWGLSGAAASLPGSPGVGTPRYSAPEQRLGQPIDARADVYGLGALLFFLAFRRPPERYAFEEPQAFDEADLEGLGARAGEHAAHVQRILARAMAAEPEQRFPTVEALSAEVASVFSGSTVALVTYVEVGSENIERYEAWVKEMVEASLQFPGHQGCSVLKLPRPRAASVTSYALVGRFASPEDAERWRGSPQRMALSERLLRMQAVERWQQRTAQGRQMWAFLDDDAPLAAVVDRPTSR
jgi:serine/threonine protein kinase